MNEIWRDEGSTWEDIIQKSPRKARAYNELGLHLLEIGDHAGALSVLGRSLALNPYQPQVYINRNKEGNGITCFFYCQEH